ncbi:MAG TPA: hypothetical protein VNN80_02815 [Polyangiaceae bacterium]|nr:hypothetical protein [Polyangiaceae bacterium]
MLPAVLPKPCSEAASHVAPDAARSLELHLRPVPADAGGAIAVRMVLTAPEVELLPLRPPAGLRQPLEVRVSLERPGCDPATGEPRLQRRVLRAEPGALLSLGTTSPSGDPARLELEYQLDVTGDGLLNERRFLADGRQLFFSPASRETPRVPTLVAIDASAYGVDGRAVSSIGLGAERRAPMTQRAIDDAVFAAGYLGSAVFEAPEGHDEAAWFGSTLFDPRPLAAEVASFRSAVRERLRDRYYVPLTLIASVENALPAFDVRRAPASVVLRVAPGQLLTAQLRLSILHQVLKEWIGGRLTLVDETGAETVWFTEGLCRYLARQLAFEFGLISPLEYLEEINGLTAIQSVLGAPEHAAACAAEATLPGGAFSSCRNLLALARGALLAGELDRVLAARGKSLSELLAGWLRQAQAPLTPNTWASALQRDAGEPAIALLAGFARGAAIVPPSGAFGPCFTRAPLRLAESELGFEYRSSHASAGPRWLVTRVAEQSPAFATGLRAEAAINAIDFAPYAADRPIRVLLADAQPLEYRPSTHTVPSVSWKRVASVPDRRCLKP